MTISAVIVDDERLARARVARLLESHVDIEVIGECRNGAEAVEFINTRKPELIFLDVQMPDMDGFAVLERANLKYNPFIIFATAYDQYALRAFDVHAIDYLLKPFDQERFDESLARAIRQLRLHETSERTASLSISFGTITVKLPASLILSTSANGTRPFLLRRMILCACSRTGTT